MQHWRAGHPAWAASVERTFNLGANRRSTRTYTRFRHQKMQEHAASRLANMLITRCHCLLKNQLTPQPIRAQIQKQGRHMDTYTTSSTAAQETRLENRGSAATCLTHPRNALQQLACTTTHDPRTAMPRTEQAETTTQASETERETRVGHLRRGRRRLSSLRTQTIFIETLAARRNPPFQGAPSETQLSNAMCERSG